MSRIFVFSSLVVLAVSSPACDDPESAFLFDHAVGTGNEFEGAACEAATESTASFCTDHACGKQYKASCVAGRWVCGTFYAECSTGLGTDREVAR